MSVTVAKLTNECISTGTHTILGDPRPRLIRFATTARDYRLRQAVADHEREEPQCLSRSRRVC
jgi:hypothetical protein